MVTIETAKRQLHMSTVADLLLAVISLSHYTISSSPTSLFNIDLFLILLILFLLLGLLTILLAPSSIPTPPIASFISLFLLLDSGYSSFHPLLILLHLPISYSSTTYLKHLIYKARNLQCRLKLSPARQTDRAKYSTVLYQYSRKQSIN